MSSSLGTIVLFVALHQLLISKSLTGAINYVLIFILTTLAVFSSSGVDLIFVVLALVYSSVFLLITLLTTHLANYWSLVAKNSNKRLAGPFLTLAVSVILFIKSTNAKTVNYTKVAHFFALSSSNVTSLLYFLHLSFYKLFIVEALLLNLYLFFGLVVATIIVQLRYFFTQDALPQHLFSLTAHHGAQALTIRLANSFKRQVRRKNTSLLKFIALLCYKN